MRIFSSAYAENRCGELIDAARVVPLAATRYAKPFVMVMAVQEFVELPVGTPCLGTRGKATNSPRPS